MELENLLELSPEIRYVATNLGGEVRMRSRPDLANASSSESDRARNAGSPAQALVV